MDPEIQPETPEVVSPVIPYAPEPVDLQAPPPDRPYRGLKWVFVGDQGLRAGWSVLIFVAIFMCVASGLGALFAKLHLIDRGSGLTPKGAFFSEFLAFAAMVIGAALVALIERRGILDYNLRGTRRVFHFAGGLVAGFAALSALVAALAWGGWLHFGPRALSGSQIFFYAALWGTVFLMVGFVEEGTMRCFFLYTLARGLNFWLAAGIVGAICLRLLIHTKGNGVWGVYIMALLGVVPCLMLQLKKAPSSGFWQAAWVTSTFFGFGHTGNNGENWIGIFAAGFIGFVFCVSVWVTGSAWWAIGCHAAWDWAETYFYGTADSGFVAPGHLLSTSTGGNPLWSGGADGPEGSLLIVPIVLLLLAYLLLLYRLRGGATQLGTVVEQSSINSAI